MDKNSKHGRMYSAEEKAAAVWMVRTLRAELGKNRGTAQRVATQLGYGLESVRSWVRQADIDEGKREVVPSDFDAGADKVLVNTAAYSAPKLLEAIAGSYGARD